MRKLSLFICGLFLVASMAACATYPVPMAVTNQPIGKKIGKASGRIYFGVFGDASEANIPEAARDGNITRVSTVDLQVNNVMGVVQTITCVVTGE